MLPSHDLHVHTSYSDGSTSVSRMVESASEKNLKALAIADHGPELSVGIDSGKISRMITDVEVQKEDSDIELFLAMEANVVDSEGNIDLNENTVEKLDLLIAGVHYLDSPSFSRESAANDYFERIIKTMKNYEIDIVAHPFWYHENLSNYLPKENIEKFVEVAVEEEIAIELNEKYHAPNEDVLNLCEEKGAIFSLGADAHSPKRVGDNNWGGNSLDKLGIDDGRLLLDRLM